MTKAEVCAHIAEFGILPAARVSAEGDARFAAMPSEQRVEVLAHMLAEHAAGVLGFCSRGPEERGTSARHPPPAAPGPRAYPPTGHPLQASATG